MSDTKEKKIEKLVAPKKLHGIKDMKGKYVWGFSSSGDIEEIGSKINEIIDKLNEK